MRTGTIIMIAPGERHERHPGIEGYTRCLAASGSVEDCTGTAAETWTITAGGSLKSGGRCLGIANGKPAMQACGDSNAQHWKYTLLGNLISGDHKCLSSSGSVGNLQKVSLEACGHNRPDQIWSLPN